MKICQIVPALPPIVDGLGDYSLALAKALKTAGTESSFVVPGHYPKRLENFSVTSTPKGDGEKLYRTLEATQTRNLLVHYSGYGYARWGLCDWLLDGVIKWKCANKNRRVITLFHELYATGPMWRTSFWTCVPQKLLAQRLFQYSDYTISTTASTTQKLQNWNDAKDIQFNPVFSNVGELRELHSFDERSATAVVFGRLEKRKRLVSSLCDKHGEIILKRLKQEGIERIIDIGPAPEVVLPTLKTLGIAVESMGILKNEEISKQLCKAKVGLVNYPSDVLTKSGISAAYLAHGLATVNTYAGDRTASELKDGIEFISTKRLLTDQPDFKQIAKDGYNWYCGHNRSETANLILKAVR